MGPSVVHDDRVSRLGLEGDGVGDRLFELLWKRDLFSDSALALRIPDTVIFRYGAPALWYFTSVDGTIKRKTKAKVNGEYIFKEFVKRESASGIVACYVSSVHADADSPALGGVSASGHDSNEHEIAAGTRTTIEYLDRAGLQDFLFNRQRVRVDGILQRFVEPKGDHNNMIRVLWSPKVCLLERRINRRKMSDTKYDVYERAVTFEGPDFLSEVTPVRGPSMTMQVHDVADSIVQHIAAVTGDKMKISRMALNFKVDDRDRLWLLFASSVRMRGGKARQVGQGASLLEKGLSNTPLEADAILQVPEHVRRLGTTQPSRPVTLQCTCQCPACEEKVEPGSFCDVSYKVIIEYEEKRQGDKQPLPAPLWPKMPSDEVSPSVVPATLQQLHPRLKPEEYGRFRHDVAFLYKTASVCEACYLRFSAPQLGSQYSAACCLEELEETNLVGTKALEPERLRKRQKATRRRVLEQKAEAEGTAEELLRCRTEKPKPQRAQSCPKLPSWGAGHLGPIVRPPAPVLESRPRPPGGAAPQWGDLRAMRSQTAPTELSPQRRRRVPPLLGEPYLKDLQAFAISCPDRAKQVVPTMPPTAGPSRRGNGSRQAATAAESPARPAVPTAAVAEDAEAMPPAGAGAEEENVETRQTRAPRPRLRSDIEEDEEENIEAGIEEDEDGEDDYEEREGLATSTSAVGPEVVLDDSDGDVLDHPLVRRLTSEFRDKRWSKWPPTCDTEAPSGSRTPTTRPPSQSGGSRPSSYPTSVNSSRPISRTWSAQSGTRPFQRSQAQRSSSDRPWSSPLVARGGGSRADRETEALAQLHRPASSPQIRPPRPGTASRPSRPQSSQFPSRTSLP